MINNKIKIIVLVIIIVSILNFGVSFAVFTVNQKIVSNGSYIAKNVNVIIDNVELLNENQGCNSTEIIANNTNLNIKLNLMFPGAYCSYKLSIKNIGELEAVINDINYHIDENASRYIDVLMYYKNKSDLLKVNGEDIYSNVLDKLEINKNEELYLVIKYKSSQNNLNEDLELKEINIELIYNNYKEN